MKNQKIIIFQSFVHFSQGFYSIGDIGVCWIIILFFEDIEIELHNLNDDINGNRNKIKNRFIDIIQFHSTAKELSNDFN